jgi:hypothetical protein
VVVDPSSVSVTYHERASLFAAIFSDALHISGSEQLGSRRGIIPSGRFSQRSTSTLRQCPITQRRSR